MLRCSYHLMSLRHSVLVHRKGCQDQSYQSCWVGKWKQARWTWGAFQNATRQLFGSVVKKKFINVVLINNTYLYIEFVVLECRVKLQHYWSLKRRSHLFVVEQVPEIHQYWKSNLVEIHWGNVHSQNHLRLVDSSMEPNHLLHIFFVNVELRVLLIESVVSLFLVWFECQRKTIRNFNDLPVNAT